MLPIVVGSLALAVDFGSLTVQRRVAQSVVDLAALHAASDLARPKEAVLAYLSANGFDHLVETPSGLVDREGRAVSENATNAAVLHIETGRYEPDAARLAGERFVAGAEPANAARVTSRETGRLHFASIFADAPPIVTSGTAATRKVAAFSIGSRLASLEGGVLNGVIGGLLGAELSLSVMDYRALADVDVDMPRLMGAIAQHIGLTAVSYDRLLQESITAGTLSSALLQSGDFSPGQMAILARIEAALRNSQATVSLARFFDAGPMASLAVGTAPGFDVSAGVLDLFSAFGSLANGGKQIALSVASGIPGLVEVDLKLAIGEPPVGTSWLAVGEKGATVRTAQTRLALDVALPGLGVLPSVHLPVYLEVAHAQATLDAIECGAGGRVRSVDLLARPGVMQAAIGTMTPSRFADFNRAPALSPAKLVELELRVLFLQLKVLLEGAAHVDVASGAPVRQSFSAAEIEAGVLKTVSSRNLVASLASSLGDRLQVSIKPSLVDGVTEPLLRSTLKTVLTLAAGPIDIVIDNALAAAGVKVGEADLRVTGARCGQPLLVQ